MVFSRTQTIVWVADIALRCRITASSCSKLTSRLIPRVIVPDNTHMCCFGQRLVTLPYLFVEDSMLLRNLLPPIFIDFDSLPLQKIPVWYPIANQKQFLPCSITSLTELSSPMWSTLQWDYSPARGSLLFLIWMTVLTGWNANWYSNAAWDNARCWQNTEETR